MLLIDVGNSRMKWATLGPAGLGGFGVAVLDTATLDANLLSAWPDHVVPPQQVWISNVAGLEVAHRLRLAVRDRWDFDPRFVYAKPQAFGVRCAYKAPMRLGADRWAKLVAARAIIKGNTCIIDSGTALTMDALDKTGQHLGGLIVPGFTLMQRALLKETGGIRAALGAEPPHDGLEPDGFLGQDTAGCVGNGCFQAVVGFVQRALLMLRKRWSTGFTVLVTGGDAGRLLPYLPRQTRHEQYLVLQGLAVIAQWGREWNNGQLVATGRQGEANVPVWQNAAVPVRAHDDLDEQAGVAQSVERLPCKQ